MENKELGQLEKDVIERYLGRKDYVVRVEKDKDKKWIIKVYYKGIQSFFVKGDNLKLNVSMFTIKGQKDDFDELNDKEKKLLNEINAHFEIGFRTNDNNNYKYRFKIEHSSSEGNYNRNKANKIYDEIEKAIDKILGSNTDKVFNIIKNKVITDYLYFNYSGKIDYDSLIKLSKVCVTNTAGDKGKEAGIHMIDMNEKVVLNGDINFEKIDKLMEGRINIYNGADPYKKREKEYQQTLINKMFVELDNKSENKEINLLKKGPFNKNTYPFLMEFNFYEDVKTDRNAHSKKGRVDNVFIKDNKVLFVEIKIDIDVIVGKNGIHKHLIDILNGIEKNNEFIEELNMYIKNYNEGIGYIPEKERYKVDEILNEKEIEFSIICGYPKGKIGVVKKKIDDCYYISAKEAGVENKDDKSYEKYLNMTIAELRNELEKNKVKCVTSIYLVDENYEQFDLYPVKEEGVL